MVSARNLAVVNEGGVSEANTKGSSEPPLLHFELAKPYYSYAKNWNFLSRAS